MGWHFRAMSGTDPFVIDQTVTVSFQGQPRQRVQALLAEVGETLAALVTSITPGPDWVVKLKMLLE